MDPVQNAASVRRIPLVDLPLDDAGLEQLVGQLDAALITHLHRDHFDARAEEILPRSLPILCQPLDADRFAQLGFRTVLPVERELAWQGIQVVRAGGRHGTGEVGERMGAVSGFVLHAAGEPSLYLAGDTIWCAEVEETIAARRPRVIVVNAGAAQFLTGGPITMTAEDVIRVCQAAPDATVVPVHMGALNHCLLSRADLGSALGEADLLNRVWIPANGETRTFFSHEV